MGAVAMSGGNDEASRSRGSNLRGNAYSIGDSSKRSKENSLRKLKSR